jgi:hypothetical protein
MSKGFIKIDHTLMHTAAWRSLHATEVAILIDLWGRHNGRNNGEVAYGLNDAQRAGGCRRHTAIKRLRSLEDKGFVVATRRGSFAIKRGTFIGRTTTWRLTMEPCNGQTPSREYLGWAEPDNQEKR